jgi:hypothetical protein
MWGDPGITIRRNIIDQQQVVSLGASQTLIPFQALRTVGYLRGVWLNSPLLAGTGALGGGTLTQQSGGQFPQLRVIKRCTMNLQASVNVIDVDGIDLAWLAYIGSGRKFSRVQGSVASGFSVIGAAPATDQYPYSWPTRDNSLVGLANQYVPYAQFTTPNQSLTYGMYLPISEFLIWPNAAIGTAGGVGLYTDHPMEFGLLFMQNDQQNLTPQIYVTSAYGPNNESLLTATGAATSTFTGQQWTMEAEYYDVPVNVADRPNELQSRYLIVRQSMDQPVSGGACIIKHRAAGDLMAVIYTAYNDNPTRGVLVDLTQTPSTVFALRSGSTTTRVQRSVQLLSYDALDQYGGPPPGIVVIDLRLSGIGVGWTQAIDTGQVVDVRSEITGLAASITRMHYTEIRAIPIRRPVATGAQAA